MLRRIVLLVAVIACFIIAGGTAAWRYHLAAVASLLDAQAATARAYLESAQGQRDPAAVLTVVERPGIDVREGAPPPPGGPPPLGAPPPPGGPPPPGPALAIADLARIAPRHVEVGDFSLTLLPSAPALAWWFAADVAICAALIAAVAATAGTIGASLTRAALEERRAAAAEFQRFLADAGHELRTPLTIVGGYVDVLQRCVGSDATGRRAIAGMSAEVGRMRGLVEKMLLLSRLESPIAAPRIVDVGAISDEVADAMRSAYPERNIAVHCDQAARISIDEDDLYEAERNLVENALRYAPQSPVTVSAVAQDGRVRIEVADRGPGIPEAERALVFERFYRGKERTGSSGGSGLGLAIVRRVVERWNGTVALHCDPAGGTRFVMTFPLAQGRNA